VTPDNKVVYVAAENPADDDSAVFVINASNATIIAATELPQGQEPVGIAINPAGTFVYIASEGFGSTQGVITAVPTSNNVPFTVATFPNTGPFPTGLVVSPDGTELWVANSGSPSSFNNGSVFVYHINSNGTLNLLSPLVPIGAEVTQVAFSSDATTVYALTTNDPGTITRINPTTLVPGKPLGSGTIDPTDPFALAIDPATKNLFVANEQSAVTELAPVAKNLVTVATIRMFPNSVPTGDQDLTQPVISPDGTLLYVGEPDRDGGDIGWVTLSNNAPHRLAPIPNVGDIQFLAFAPNGNRLYASDQNSDRVVFIRIH